MNTANRRDDLPESPVPSRRHFLQQAAGLAAGLGAIAQPAAAADGQTPAEALLPTVKLGHHAVTRLIVGGNPIYGYSHFNTLLSQHQIAWHTPERVVELLKRCEQAGINTWQNSYLPSDPPQMFKAIQATRKPCLAYKVLAAGRRISTPAEVRRSFEAALANIKPTDALIVGMYQQFGDQVGENAATVRDLCRRAR